MPRQIITSPKVITPRRALARTTVQAAVAILPSHMETTSWQP
jgi:hypothetical protein